MATVVHMVTNIRMKEGFEVDFIAVEYDPCRP